MSEKKVTVNTTPFCSLLTLLFVGLKLTGYINWSWTWVLSPVWIPAVIAVAFILLGIVFIALDSTPRGRK